MTTVTVCFPVDQVVQFDAMATVETTLWPVPDLRAGRHRDNPAGDRNTSTSP